MKGYKHKFKVGDTVWSISPIFKHCCKCGQQIEDKGRWAPFKHVVKEQTVDFQCNLAYRITDSIPGPVREFNLYRIRKEAMVVCKKYDKQDRRK